MSRTKPIVLAILQKLEKAIVQINAAIVIGCGTLLFLFIFLVVADITGRYLFSKPVPGTLEIGEGVLAFLIFPVLASVLMRGEHLRVTLFFDHISIKWREWLEIIGFGMGFLLMFFITWQSLPFAVHSYKLREAGVVVPIPLYPAKFAYFVGCLMFCIQFLIEFVRHLLSKLGDRFLADDGENRC